jgi:DNA-binding NarL/FixJ family response regulator
MKRIRLLLADDHQVVREGLARILDRPEFEIVGSVPNGAALIEAATRLDPDVILADVSMPVLGGMEALRQIRRIKPEAKVIMLTMHPEVPYALEALSAGASGYVLKSSPNDELFAAIHEALRGGIYLASDIREATMLAYYSSPKKGRARLDLLTPRQREVLALLVQGLQVKEIASRLNVSAKTVEFHKQTMKQTLGVHTVAELVVYATNHGIHA